jgi:hypothetical protein
MRGNMNIFKMNEHQTLRMSTLGILILVLLTGCAGQYGSYRRDSGVQQSFESNQVPADYKYFYYGRENEPIVIFGIEKKYEMNSTMWKEVNADATEFRDLITRIWGDYGYSKFGADILDPNGNKVGILYTAIRETTLKFGINNQISVIPNTPFLWGPVADSGGGVWAP